MNALGFIGGFLHLAVLIVIIVAIVALVRRNGIVRPMFGWYV